MQFSSNMDSNGKRIFNKVKKVTLENPNEKYPLKLTQKIVLSHDTRLFRHATANTGPNVDS